MLIVYGAILPLLFPSSGIIIDRRIDTSVDSINWGYVTVGEPVNRSVLLTNVGNVNFGNFSLSVQNVTGLIDYTLTCNLEGQSLLVGETKTAIFTLTVLTYNNTNFSLDIVITGTELV